MTAESEPFDAALLERVLDLLVEPPCSHCVYNASNLCSGNECRSGIRKYITKKLAKPQKKTRGGK